MRIGLTRFVAASLLVHAAFLVAPWPGRETAGGAASQGAAVLAVRLEAAADGASTAQGEAKPDDVSVADAADRSEPIDPEGGPVRARTSSADAARLPVPADPPDIADATEPAPPAERAERANVSAMTDRTEHAREAEADLPAPVIDAVPSAPPADGRVAEASFFPEAQGAGDGPKALLSSAPLPSAAQARAEEASRAPVPDSRADSAGMPDGAAALGAARPDPERADRRTAGQIAQRLSEAVQTHFHYPSLARRRGLEGEVVIGLRVEGDGRLTAIHVVTSSGHRLLDSAAIESLNRAERLADASGVPVGGLELTLPVRYRLVDA